MTGAASVTETGLRVPSRVAAPIDLLLDDVRVWSFLASRDGVPDGDHLAVEWPPSLLALPRRRRPGHAGRGRRDPARPGAPVRDGDGPDPRGRRAGPPGRPRQGRTPATRLRDHLRPGAGRGRRRRQRPPRRPDRPVGAGRLPELRLPAGRRPHGPPDRPRLRCGRLVPEPARPSLRRGARVPHARAPAPPAAGTTSARCRRPTSRSRCPSRAAAAAGSTSSAPTTSTTSSTCCPA